MAYLRSGPISFEFQYDSWQSASVISQVRFMISGFCPLNDAVMKQRPDTGVGPDGFVVREANKSTLVKTIRQAIASGQRVEWQSGDENPFSITLFLDENLSYQLYAYADTAHFKGAKGVGGQGLALRMNAKRSQLERFVDELDQEYTAFKERFRMGEVLDKTADNPASVKLDVLDNLTITQDFCFTEVSESRLLSLFKLNTMVLTADEVTQELNYHRRSVRDGQPCVLIQEGYGDYYEDFDDLEDCLRHMYLGILHVDGETAWVEPECHMSLWDRVMKAHRPAKSSLTRFDVRRYPCINGHAMDGPPFDLNEGTDPGLRNLTGRLADCSCGIEECGCHFALIRNYRVLVYLHTDSLSFHHLVLFPQENEIEASGLDPALGRGV